MRGRLCRQSLRTPERLLFGSAAVLPQADEQVLGTQEWKSCYRVQDDVVNLEVSCGEELWVLAFGPHDNIADVGEFGDGKVLIGVTGFELHNLQ